MSSEHARIARLKQRFLQTTGDVTLGIGDDCAVLAPSSLARVWTIDAAVEGVHFSRDFMSEAEAGYRAFMAAASDIAAMGGRACSALSALAFPESFEDSAFDRLIAGIAEAAETLQVPVIGGNLARASELSITTTVLGECTRVVTRAGAKPGQGVFVSGSLGGAALGLMALRRNLRSAARFFQVVERFLRPRARLELAPALAAHASAAIDVSDGLVQDLEHLCAASGVGARIAFARIPAPDDFAALAAELGADAAALVLGGGEDYELLFTAERDAVPESLGTYIGHVVSDGGVQVLDAQGQPLARQAGFDHFRGC